MSYAKPAAAEFGFFFDFIPGGLRMTDKMGGGSIIIMLDDWEVLRFALDQNMRAIEAEQPSESP